MFKEAEPKLSRQQKKEIKMVVDRYLRIKFKRRFRLLTGIKLK